MASLNTLRTRGGIIISIVIGLALIAFLMGDFTPRSCSKITVGSIDGHKIGYEEYLYQAERFQVIVQTMQNKEALSSEETDIARNMAWEGLVAEYVYRPGLERLGLSNSEAEQIDMVSGQYLSPVITGNFANQRTGIFDPAVLSNFIIQKDYDQSGRLDALWKYMEEQMNDQRSMSKFFALIEKGIYVTDLEAEASLLAYGNTYDIELAAKSYSSIADSLVNITMADIREYYHAHKSKYKQEPSREIEYVVFDLLPSERDYAEAERYINGIAAEFAESDNPMQFALYNSTITTSQQYLSETQVDRAIAATVFNDPDAMYGPVLSGDYYTLARLADATYAPEQVAAKHILVSPNERELADSIASAIRQGADFEMLAVEYSIDPSAQMNGGDLGRFAPEQMVPEFSDAVVAARIGDVFTVDTDFGIHVVQVTEKDAPVRKAQIATIRYKVEPSSATQQEIYEQASKFLTEASGSYDNFKKASAEGALAKRVARIRTSDRSISGLQDSRELVRWAFDSKKGQVSDILEIGGDYVIAALAEVRTDEYSRPEDVADQIRPVVLRDKKARLIMDDMQGGDLRQVASSWNVETTTVEEISFAPFDVPGVGVGPRLIGAVAAANAGRLSKPVKGETAVYIFEKTAVNPVEEITAESEKIRLEATAASYLSERLGQAMSESAKVTDNRVRYF
ncbi:MAG: peptidylprolyl isomerase [Rikenellaceae bacterium]|nr:peptidylprolyl isomerase [Rikenellaceae bacterium]